MSFMKHYTIYKIKIQNGWICNYILDLSKDNFKKSDCYKTGQGIILTGPSQAVMSYFVK